MIFNSIPVVMYHHIMPEIKELNVTPKVFEEQISALKRHGWKTLDGCEFLYLMQNPAKQRGKCVLLTFDDGFLDNYIYAYPILKKYKMKAMLFVATDFIVDLDIKRKNFKPIEHKEIWKLAHTERKYEVMCTWNEIREMQEEEVFDIQSHGHTHEIPEFIKKNDYEKLKDDLMLSKDLLKKYLNKEPLHLAWPKGVYNDMAIKTAKEVGFKALYTTQRGANTEDLFNVKRIAVKCKGSGWFKIKLSIYSSSLISKIYSKIRL